MLVSSETPQLADNTSQGLCPDQRELVEVGGIDDEDFPLDVPAYYDWMLQPSSRHRFRRIVAFIGVMVTLLIALSALIVYSSSTVPPSVFVSPVSSSH